MRHGVGLGGQFLGKTQAHRAFQAHGAELAAGPGDGEQRRVEAAGGHGLGAEAIALAQHHGEERHREAGGGDEHARDMPHGGLFFRLRADHKAGGVAQ